jgi:MATE family multidrug resistance protein
VTSGAVPLVSDDERSLSVRDEAIRIAKLAWPITLAQFGMISLHLVDTAIVGRSSVENLAGVALGRSISFLTLSAGMGIPLSLEALATQAVGAGEPENAFAAFRGVIRTCFVAWFPITLVSLACTLVLGPLGVEPAVSRKALLFLIGNAPGAFGFLLFLAAKSYLQANGRTTPALIAAVVANIVNYGTCKLLVGGSAPLGLPPLGAFGAGISASFAALILGGIPLYAAWRVRPAREVEPLGLVRVLGLGVPIGLQLLAEVGVFSVVALVAGRLGSSVVAAHQVAIGLASATFMIALGISGAAAVRVGAAVGAKRSPRRSGYVAVGLGVSTMTIGALVFLLAPHVVVEPFTNDAEVRSIAIQLLRIAAVFQLFDATQGVLAGCLRGAGDVRFPFAVMLIGYWVVAFPLSLTLCFGLGWGAVGLWWGLSAGLCLVALSLFARFTRITSRSIDRV